MVRNKFLEFGNRALMTDLYELTMAAGYLENDYNPEATFELFVRRMPPQRGFLVAAGLESALDYLVDLHFEPEEVQYLKSLPAFKNVSAKFFDFLSGFRFTGDVWAIPEGRVCFQDEPLLRVSGPLIEAQIVETFLLSTINFQTLVATKSARVVQAAQGRSVVDFGTRRAHGPAAGVLAARASYIGGCRGTSNVYAAMKLGIAVVGTMAHSWVMAFASEEQAFAAYQRIFPETTVLLLDTYDTLSAAEKAAAMSGSIVGVRLDSGNLCDLSVAVRERLDRAGKQDVKIVLSGDLNEYIIEDLIRNGAQADMFGVGTEMVTSRDAPALQGVYKLVEIRNEERCDYKIKLSAEKQTYPGKKQVFRQSDSRGMFQKDVVACAHETLAGEPLLVQFIKAGQLCQELPDVHALRQRAQQDISRLPEGVRRLRDPEPYPVEISRGLAELMESVRKGLLKK